MITISVCMIVKNEEEVLARCLTSVKAIADEIIVVDTGSDDRTKEIAKEFTNRVFEFKWIDDFAAARNFSFSQATMDYIMWLDADDIIQDADQDGFLKLKKMLPPDTDVVMLPYHTGFDAEGNPSFSYFRERLLKREHGFQWKGAIHEAITPEGKIVYLDSAAVTHKKIHPSDPNRNLNIFEKIRSSGTELNPREQFYYARELYYHKRYTDAITVYEKFLNDGMGWVENCIGACQFLAYCYYELGEETKALSALLRSLEYDVPRAELCCDIGNHFFHRNRLEQAVFWYEQAANCPRNDLSGGFVQPDCYGYIPYLQLCVCYDRLGDSYKAQRYNELAGAIKPNDPAVLQNRDYFSQKIKNTPSF
jgi:glycosyltransferase involved in cell wall biosynthesis